MPIITKIKQALLNNYSSVSVQQAQKNTEYWLMFANMFREQAARVLQRNWRRKKALPAPKEYSETLSDTARLMRFIKEPRNPSKMLEHVARIKRGDWINLDFNDDEFERNIYRALRLKQIDRYDLATTLLLYHAQIEFASPIKQYRFTEPGPYLLSSITYATETSTADFYQRLATLPPAQQCYFTVNFSPLRVALFLYDGLFINYDKTHYQNILKVYFSQLASTDQQIKESLAHLNHPELGEKARVFLGATIKKIHHNFAQNLDYSLIKMSPHQFCRNPNSTANKHVIQGSMDNKSQYLLSNVYATNTNAPGVIISPDFDKNNLHSPLLCMVIPTQPVFFMALQDAIHGTKHTTYPFFTAGRVSTRFMRHLEEHPQQFGHHGPLRPLEMHHPDLLQNPNPHGCGKVYSFVLEWHDLFHCWHNGMVTSKDFIRYARILLSSATGYAMSKAIWYLTDMDMAFYHTVRDVMKDKSLPPLAPALVSVMALSMILSKLGKGMWEQTDRHDINLLLIIDMIIHHERWTNQFLPNIPPQMAFNMEKENVWLGNECTFDGDLEHNFFNKDLSHFQKTFRAIESIIKSHPLNPQIIPNDKLKVNPTILVAKYYILAYRLKSHPEGMVLCNQLVAMGLEKFLAWNRNGGLRLRSQNVEIESLTGDALYQQLAAEWECHLRMGPLSPSPAPSRSLYI